MSQPGLTPIPRSPLYEQVAERLRGYIETQGLKPGDRLISERDLAEQLGVSRTSVRQALTALRVQGLVEIKHGDGVFLLEQPGAIVPTLASEIVDSEGDHPMIWEVREAIEVQAARLAARRSSAADRAAMGAALEQMERSIAAGDDGIDGDRAFHAALAVAAHNPLLQQLTEQLLGVFDRTSAASLTLAGRPDVSLAGHREILAAIARGDEAAAAEAMRQHVMTSGQRVAERSGVVQRR
ncbi:FadR/GntR family transcriptional regulator [Conexibacter stalactiti]|uniref:FadR/GntR family transcriptional regulator n=1 Tax=Conexibacter stalactiti TaxID=1940611 RepID=A0ABU4HJ89_9ACTN|nr:FadR/GntR family transcriptional regulator [Conexibacter stalactiti]MDW5593388.1 FadR/GntR family transcriptional regulator [Conexibacter stalactiti]MEC5034029.1 FadR/GntR family transcriptional regulator [Conexibacter stalactiti]